MKKKNSNRYILLHKTDSTQRVINRIEKELNIQCVSSSELSSTVRAKSILNSGSGVFFKNLGITVVENIEEEKLVDSLNSSSSLLHWELERKFYPVSELEYLANIKKSLLLLEQQVVELETSLLSKDETIKKIVEQRTWGMDILEVQKSKYSGAGINIAILDTGFYKEHPDFVGRTIEGKSFIDNQAWDFDSYGHGTHCTGTASGYVSLDNKKRYGIAYESNIFIGKVLSDSAVGSTSTILDGIDWALEKECQVISMSLGSAVAIGEKPSPIFEHVGRKALEQRCLIVAASGNDSHRPDGIPKPVSSPANAESIMAVAALDKYLKVASFSNAGINASDGGRIDLSAPGVDIFSSYSNASHYKKMSGTSMATPHVAGVAALYFEAFPTLSAAEIWLKMEKDSLELTGQRRRDIGAGMVKVV